MQFYTRYLLTGLFASLVFLSACKKNEIPKEPVASVRMSLDSIILANDDFLGTRLSIILDNFPEGTSNSAEWRVDNPRIAEVTAEGVVWPKGAGITYVFGKLLNGKGEAKCKIIVTDGNDYKFRLVLTDKGKSDYSIGNPEAFLSKKAIERRRKQHIPIDVSDLPISREYLKAITEVGGTIVAKSKWLNTVCVNVRDQFLIDKYKALPFVKEVALVYFGKRKQNLNVPKYIDSPQSGSAGNLGTSIDYGAAALNINTVKGEALHQQGFKGAGMDIAVIDAGFIHLRDNAAFSNVHIKGAKSFVYENEDPYSIDTHGVWVTSCMAVSKPGSYVGTAPEANYWLLRTEDSATEFPVEEDYWTSAIEFADSAGVDLVNSSLTYSDGYSSLIKRYTATDMDGKTALATKAANMAFKKGIFIVNCAGNEQKWVGTPADSPSVLTTGSINSDGKQNYFTSWGMTADGRIKPDVMAMGGNAAVINSSGTTENRSGTSYASPIMCGLVACLWEANPQLTNKDLMEIIRKSADRASHPELPFGYGIADMKKAMELAKIKVGAR
ncbi:S8 family serine peptidase [Mucilaginibacter sp. Bleaf8]|uniref:S8 family serine peptidase n=1 Tax=Mucilaginibacter sp. Bleaf8 TaxID=2834430 RepID=UPI001BCF0839|nr:S8 family serine peptidase [Mucilaginibacter sp. Bleaf8]MBS7566683.1 S8 family serine peptidase [Mucilaginibacter sp. Bleaf8]